MYSDDQLRQLHESVMEHMIKAKWLLRYTFTPGKGFHLVWLERGAIAALKLKEWYKVLNLGNGDSRPVFAYELACGRSLVRAFEASMVNEQLSRLVECGFATSACLNDGGTYDITWTPAGVDFCRDLTIMVAELGLRADEDNMLILFGIAQTWAPTGDTKICFG